MTLPAGVRLIATYGSLRLGQYNLRWFNEHYPDQIGYLDTLKAKNFKLYDLGAYPAAVPADDGNLVIERFVVTDAVFTAIHVMELAAGYEAVELDDMNGTVMWVMRRKPEEGVLVESGDWVQHLDAKEVVHENA